MKTIRDYFSLTPHQEQQFAALDALYRMWNERINVISRKDIDNLQERHILHSLAIAQFIRFAPNSQILDIGTGGGFPGIPLAILMPECQFTLIDGVGKKIRVATEVAKAINLDNVQCIQRRAEEERGKYDFIVSRAVMPLPDLVKLVRKNIAPKQHNAIPNGVIVLKGGNLCSELAPFKNIVESTDVSTLFDGDWYAEKKIIYLPIKAN